MSRARTGRGRRRRQFLHVTSRDVGEFAQVIARQRPRRNMLQLAEVAGRDVQEGEVCPGVGVTRVPDDKVEEDEEGR